jgi:hypothetical protein
MNQLLAMEKHSQILGNLKMNLESIRESTGYTLEQLEFAITQCKGALDQMRDLVFADGFPDQVSEIHFFKNLKPEVFSQLLYYLRLFEIQSSLSAFDKENQIQHYKKRIKKCIQFFKEHLTEVQYFQCGHTHMDKSYFTRDSLEIPLPKKSEYYLIDEKFHTWHDHIFSEIISNQMLINYLQKEIARLEKLEIGTRTFLGTKPRWTGDKVYLIELAYGMYYTGMINNGQTEIKTIVETLEQLFDIDLENYSRTFHDIKRRKIDRTKFLDIMKSKLENKIEEFIR